MAFNRFTTKLGQAVTDAEKTEMDPALKEALRQFDETTKLGDQSKDAAEEALPIVGSSANVTKIEALGDLMKQAAAKYGLDEPEHQGLHAGGQLLMGIDIRQEKGETKYKGALTGSVRALQGHPRFQRIVEEGKDETGERHDMDGAKIKNKSGKDQSRVQTTTKVYEDQKAMVEKMVSTLEEHRDEQRRAAKSMAEALREFHQRAGEVIDGNIGNMG